MMALAGLGGPKATLYIRYRGGIGDRTIALELVTPAQILTPLKLIYDGMAAEKGRVLVGCRPYAPGHHFVVYDTGHGLPPEALEKLLNPHIGAVQFEPGSAGLELARDMQRKVPGSTVALMTHDRSIEALYLIVIGLIGAGGFNLG